MHPRPTTSINPARELLDDFPEYATTKILDHLRSTEYAGRGAARTNSADVAGSTRAGSAPTSRKISWVNPNHVVSPEFVPWNVPA